MFRRSLDIKLQDKIINTKHTRLENLTPTTIDKDNKLYRIKLNSREIEEMSSVSKPTKLKYSLVTPVPIFSNLKESQVEGVEYIGQSNSLIINRLKKKGRCFKCYKVGHLFANFQLVALLKAIAKNSKE